MQQEAGIAIKGLVFAGLLAGVGICAAYAGIVEQTEPVMSDIRYQDALAVKCHDGRSLSAPKAPECGEIDKLSLEIIAKVKQLIPGPFPYFLSLR
jgi:hypothetical protein